jgi:hypothetical protein
VQTWGLPDPIKFTVWRQGTTAGAIGNPTGGANVVSAGYRAIRVTTIPPGSDAGPSRPASESELLCALLRGNEASACDAKLALVNVAADAAVASPWKPREKCPE